MQNTYICKIKAAISYSVISSTMCLFSYKHFCCYFCHWDAVHFLDKNPAKQSTTINFTSSHSRFVYHLLRWCLGFI